MTLKTSIVITAEQAQALRQIAGLIAQVRRVGGEANKSGRSAADGLAQVGKEARQAGAAGRRSGDDIAKGLRGARDEARTLAGELGRLKRDVIAFFSIRATFRLFADVTRTAIEFDGLQLAMKAVKGSGEAAAEELAFVRSEADRLGLNLVVSTRQFVALSAAAKGTALEGQGVRDIFTAISEASTVLGLSQQQLEGALLAVQQMISKGKVSSEELRQQLGERLFGAMQIAARAIGLTTDSMEELLERGMLPADKFLPAFARQLRKEFGAGVKEATGTARAEIERFNNALTDLQLQFASAGFLDALAGAFRDISAALSDPEMRAGIAELGAFIGGAIKFVVDNADKLAIAAAALTGAKVGAGIGRIGGAKGAVAGGILGSLAGIAAALAGLPGGDAAPTKERTAADRQAVLERQLRSLRDARLTTFGKERAQLERDIADQEARLDKVKQEVANEVAAKATQAAEGDSTFGARAAFSAFVKQFETDAEKLAEALADLRKKALAAGVQTDSPEFKRIEAAIRAKFTKQGRLPALREEFNAAAALTKDALEREGRLLAQQLEDNLVSVRGYYQERERIAEASFQNEAQRIAAERARLESFVAELRGRQGGADLNQAQQIADQIAGTEERIKRLDTELIVLGRQRGEARAAAARAERQATQELRDEIARLRDETLELSGAATPADRRAALDREFRVLRERLRANADQFPEGESILDRAIDVKAKVAEFSDLERRFNESLNRMRTAEDSINIQREAGLLTEAQARQQILELQARTADAIEATIPRLQALGDAIGPEFANRASQAVNELQRMRVVVDDMAVSINGSLREGFNGVLDDIREGTKSAKEIALDFFRAWEQGITRIASQKAADQLFGSGNAGVGGFLSKLLGFSSGGGQAITPVGNAPDFFDAFHRGGVAGRSAGLRRSVSPLAFLAAPRLHSGGVLGLAPGEVPAILQDGEEVLTARDPRHRRNAGGAVVVNIYAQDVASFRRSQAEVQATISSSVMRGRRNL